MNDEIKAVPLVDVLRAFGLLLQAASTNWSGRWWTLLLKPSLLLLSLSCSACASIFSCRARERSSPARLSRGGSGVGIGPPDRRPRLSLPRSLRVRTAQLWGETHGINQDNYVAFFCSAVPIRCDPAGHHAGRAAVPRRNAATLIASVDEVFAAVALWPGFTGRGSAPATCRPLLSASATWPICCAWTLGVRGGYGAVGAVPNAAVKWCPAWAGTVFCSGLVCISCACFVVQRHEPQPHAVDERQESSSQKSGLIQEVTTGVVRAVIERHTRGPVLMTRRRALTCLIVTFY